MDYLANTAQEVKVTADGCRGMHSLKIAGKTFLCWFCTEQTKRNTYVEINSDKTCTCCGKKVRIVHGLCVGNHVDPRDHNSDGKLCPYCSDKCKTKCFVETKDGNTCGCCNKPIPQQKTFDVLSRIMNKFVQEYGYMLDNWLPSIPAKEGKTVVRIKHGMYHYETDIKWVGVYKEIANFDRNIFPAPYDPVNRIFKICPVCIEKNVTTWVELYDDDECICLVCNSTINRRGKTVTRGPYVSWDWKHDEETPMKDAVRIQQFWDEYDKYDSVMKMINKHVVRVLL